MDARDKETEWIFTWGYEHEFPNKYIVFSGTFSEARKKMFARYGDKWAFQYPISDRARIESHGVTELRS